jgi:hypothetical protein
MGSSNLKRFACLAIPLLVIAQMTKGRHWALPQVSTETPKQAIRFDISTRSSSSDASSDRIALHPSSLQLLEHGDGADAICLLLKANNSQKLSLNSIWMQELDKIRDSLLHSPANKPFGKRSGELQKLIDQVLNALPPSRLRRSLRPQSVSPEHHPQKIRRILNIIWKRYETTKEDTANAATTPSPKLQVLVFGGSPTAGSNCERNKQLKKKQGGCAWPGHLETFLNAYLGFDAVQVVNYAMGATSSSTASMIIRTRLFPPSMMPNGPDIIVNAYAVNDFSYYDSGEFPKMVQDFIESTNTLSSCHGDRPLVVYLDDFVVNYARGGKLLTSETYNADIGKWMQWYQVMTVAYSDVVRDMVYANRDEQVLLVDRKGDDRHLPWAGHIAIVLSFMFNGVNSVLDFCDDETYRSLQHGSDSKKSDIHNSTANSENATKPLTLDPSHRPVLNGQVSLSSITEAWKRQQEQNEHTCQSGGGQDQRCAFAWVALRREAEMKHLPQREGPQFQQVDGWEYRTKWPPTDYGLYATKTDGSFLLNVTDDTSTSDISGHRPVNTVTFFYMKSYSEKWQGSMISASVFLGSHENHTTPVASAEMSGFHEKKTSEFFMEKLRFANAGDHRDVLLQVRMIGGSTFRIGGLALCAQD